MFQLSVEIKNMYNATTNRQLNGLINSIVYNSDQALWRANECRILDLHFTSNWFFEYVRKTSLYICIICLFE